MKPALVIFRIGLILGIVGAPCWAQFKVTKTGDSVVDADALTIQGGFGQAINGKAFQQEALVSHAGHQYVAYYDADRRVCLARRKLPTADWTVIRFQDYDFKSNDAHNTISLGICPKDGTLHIAFDHHGHPLHYRASKKNAATRPDSMEWKASIFGPVTSELEKGKPIKITYPRFWQTPEGGLQFCYRQGGSGNGDRMLVDYDPASGTWENTRKIDSGEGPFKDAISKSDSRCSYPNGYHYGPSGKLHATWVWREHSQGANHDLMYAYSDDQGQSWLNNKGERITGPPGIDSAGLTVVTISRGHGLMNTHGQAVDSRGRVHVVMWHCTDESLEAAGSQPGEHRWGPAEARAYHHYWRDENAVWHHVELPGASGTRPKLFMDEADNAFLIFTDAKRRDTDPSRGCLVIMAATHEEGWKDWKVIHREHGPCVNEMLGDYCRWREEQVLSIMVQEMPEKPHDSTRLRIVDFVFKRTP